MATAYIQNDSWIHKNESQSRSENLVALTYKFDTNTAHAIGAVIPLGNLPFGSTVLDVKMMVTGANAGSTTGTIGVAPSSSLSSTTWTTGTGGDDDGIATSITIGTSTGTKTCAHGVLMGRPLTNTIMSGTDDDGEPLTVYLVTAGATYATTFEAYITLLVRMA